MILSLLLPAMVNLNWAFLCIFLLCGITDILDGYLARKFECKSVLGARLDSIADSMLFIIVTYCTVLLLGEKVSHFIVLLILIIIVRLANVIIALLKYKCFLMIHTLANKGTGLCIYFALFLYQITPWEGFIYTTLVIALLSAIEEALIHITQKTPDPDRRGLFY